MYKIYINDLPLIISNSKNLEVSENITIKTPFVFNKKALINYVDLLEKQSDSEECILFYTDRVVEAYEMLSTLFKIVKAAGGIVVNENEEFLIIYRNNRWDLPKGKIDKGEAIKDAAIREVIEEVGLKNLEINHQISSTYHTYRTKNNRILKPTYWYLMSCASADQKIVLQEEEGITDYRWVNKTEFMSTYSYKCFASLISLIRETKLELRV